jgi:hypothetical protein
MEEIWKTVRNGLNGAGAASLRGASRILFNPGMFLYWWNIPKSLRLDEKYKSLLSAYY